MFLGKDQFLENSDEDEGNNKGGLIEFGEDPEEISLPVKSQNG